MRFWCHFARNSLIQFRQWGEAQCEKIAPHEKRTSFDSHSEKWVKCLSQIKTKFHSDKTNAKNKLWCSFFKLISHKSILFIVHIRATTFYAQICGFVKNKSVDIDRWNNARWFGCKMTNYIQMYLYSCTAHPSTTTTSVRWRRDKRQRIQTNINYSIRRNVLHIFMDLKHTTIHNYDLVSYNFYIPRFIV